MNPGSAFWPLYGQASKEGVYSSSFTFWPIFSSEKRGLNTAEPSSRFTIFPLYSAFDSPSVTSRTWLWPFFGYSSDLKNEEEERDYLWPFWLTVSGKKRNVTRFLPFYSDERTEDSTKNWYLWPIYRNDTMQSPHLTGKRETKSFFFSTQTGLKAGHRMARNGKEPPFGRSFFITGTVTGKNPFHSLRSLNRSLIVMASKNCGLLSGESICRNGTMKGIHLSLSSGISIGMIKVKGIWAGNSSLFSDTDQLNLSVKCRS